MTLERFAIIDSTLREGEQFVSAYFTTGEKLEIARRLDAFGVEYIEVTSPLASPESLADCRRIAALGLRAKVLTHTRCHMDDARMVVGTGVDGVDVVIGASSRLRAASHGKSVDEILDLALEVVGFLKTQDVEVRFSTEDSLRSDPDDLFRLYEAVDALGVDRVGIADTVGLGTPRRVYELVAELRRRVSADIEFHGHNDSGSAIANSFAALEAGATHVDTTVLGIGERNGITPLGGLIARLYSIDPSLVSKYRLTSLPELDRYVAGLVGVEIPFNNYITGSAAFSHKAGIHAKAVLSDPSSYEILRPEDFGLTRQIHIAHRLTGWNAVRDRAAQLGLGLDDAEVKLVTARIKSLADRGPITIEDVDSLLREGMAQVEVARVADAC